MSLTSGSATSANHPVRTPERNTAVALSGARTVFGQVLGLMAATGGFTALGAYIGRDLSGGAGILFFLELFGSERN